MGQFSQASFGIRLISIISINVVSSYIYNIECYNLNSIYLILCYVDAL